MTLRLAGSTSGYTEIDCPSVGGNNTLVLPTGNGSADQALVTNGSGTLSFADRGRMVLETAKTATSTAVDFTSIPSWVKKITVLFDVVSTNGSSVPLLQLGTSSAFATSGYANACSVNANGAATVNSTTGFMLITSTYWASTGVMGGAVTLYNISSNTWCVSGAVGRSDTTQLYITAGSISLGGVLTRVRITTVNGTDTFDAGSINILYEG